MPEAAVDQNGSSVTRKDDVGPAGQIRRVQPETKTCRVQAPAQQQFRLGVPAADAAHIVPPLFWCEDVHIKRPLPHRRRRV